MYFKSLVVFLSVVICVVADGEVEARGKKKKIAFYVFLADIVLKKVFILKLIYAFIFFVVIHKAGYFLSWFVGYLKDQEQHHHHYEYPSYGPHYDHSYGPYKRKSHGIN
ncbi:unnamed protein product [Pieris brassicae]|uniref:Uncharacterized protein n=1 Tax=Pieris brassicae TaxID=7116 RepID=A0A9P0SV76_PIEBR|nr:unnamed protein product [Pieris brassicae]